MKLCNAAGVIILSLGFALPAYAEGDYRRMLNLEQAVSSLQTSTANISGRVYRTIPGQFTTMQQSVSSLSSKVDIQDAAHSDAIARLEARIVTLEAKLAAYPIPTIADCKTLTYAALNRASAGFRCYTSQGYLYEKIAHPVLGLAWKGPDGVIWGDIMGTANHPRAEELCASLGTGVRLPSTPEANAGAFRGVNEVLDMSAFAWTSTSSGKYNVNSDYFVIKDGIFAYYTGNGSDNVFGIRCMTR